MTSMREVGYVHKYLLSSMKTCKQEKAHGKKGRFWYKVLVWIPLKVASTFCVFIIFFFLHVNSNITWFYCAVDKKYYLCTIHILFSCTIHALFMSLMTLFTHLKIILLQCFQFLVSGTISSIQTDLKLCLSKFLLKNF